MVDELMNNVTNSIGYLLDEAQRDIPLAEIPEFSKIKSRSTLYERYGESVSESYRLAKALSEAYSLRGNLRTLLRALKKDTETPRSILQTYISNTEHSSKQIEDIIEALKAKKDGVDTVVRFYSSAQYILGSPRLDGME